MSVEQIQFYHPNCDSVLKVKKVDDRVMLNTLQGMSIDVEFPLDRKQAYHLLLWLQEHLR